MTPRTFLFRAIMAFSAVMAPVISALAFTVSGRVQDETGQGIPETSVWIVQEHSVQHAATSGDGSFSFTGLDAGMVQLVARKEGMALGGFTAIVAGNAELTLSLSKPVTRRIRVIDPSAQPIAGARVKSMAIGSLERPGEFSVPVMDLVEAGFPSLRSGDDGVISLVDLPHKSFVRFTLAHRKHAEQYIPYLNAEGSEQTFRLYPGIAIHGRVVGEDGKGIARAHVAVFATTASGQRQASVALTDPEGYYTMTVPHGTYHVIARHPAFAPSPPAEIHSPAHTDDRVADFRLRPACFVEGSVVGPDGKPIGAARVLYIIRDIAVNETISQTSGAFRIAVAPGDGRLRTIPPDGFLTKDVGDILLQVGEEKKIALSPIQLKASPVIVGSARCPDGTPATEAWIVSRDLDQPVWSLTDANGAFRIGLDKAPTGRTAAFRIEHNRRFLRADFQVNLDDPAPVEATLEAFEPDMRPNNSNATENQLARLVDKPAPEIACDAWFNGQPATLASLKGNVIVLMFWGGFAATGRALNEIEVLRTLHRSMRTIDDVVFIGIHDGNVDAADAKAYARQLGIDFLVGVDAKPFLTFERYRIQYLPQVLLIDKEGIIRYYDTAGRLLELIKALRR